MFPRVVVPLVEECGIASSRCGKKEKLICQGWDLKSVDGAMMCGATGVVCTGVCRVTALLRDRLCPALLRQWSVANPSVFSLCYSVLLRLVALFRDPLLPKLRLLLPHMLLRPLEDRGAVHPRATWMALHLLHCLAQQPLLLLGLYANLDCHLGSPALVERWVGEPCLGERSGTWVGRVSLLWPGAIVHAGLPRCAWCGSHYLPEEHRVRSNSTR